VYLLIFQVDENDPVYRIWRGVVFMFATGGALDTGIPPQPASTVFDEQCACKLKQAHLFTPMRTKVKAKLTS
jgi:hypothetical protein